MQARPRRADSIDAPRQSRRTSRRGWSADTETCECTACPPAGPGRGMRRTGASRRHASFWNPPSSCASFVSGTTKFQGSTSMITMGFKLPQTGKATSEDLSVIFSHFSVEQMRRRLLGEELLAIEQIFAAAAIYQILRCQGRAGPCRSAANAQAALCLRLSRSRATSETR